MVSGPVLCQQVVAVFRLWRGGDHWQASDTSEKSTSRAHNVEARQCVHSVISACHIVSTLFSLASHHKFQDEVCCSEHLALLFVSAFVGVGCNLPSSHCWRRSSLEEHLLWCLPWMFDCAASGQLAQASKEASSVCVCLSSRRCGWSRPRRDLVCPGGEGVPGTWALSCCNGEANVAGLLRAGACPSRSPVCGARRVLSGFGDKSILGPLRRGVSDSKTPGRNAREAAVIVASTASLDVRENGLAADAPRPRLG